MANFLYHNVEAAKNEAIYHLKYFAYLLNSPIHKSQEVRACWQRWSEQGLLLFFLPAYCSELNEIETQWHQLKTHEIAGRIFDNEYDLAITIIQGMNQRSQQGDYHLERFIFNSA